ncbi:hypothetical protein JW899_00720 [Candidatus Uhrbacteria bacterium]|nr:hypothetical protein [Candidatus Uhrbacteria bacterium]
MISADQVKKDRTYLGVTGTLTPDGGTAVVADLFNGKTANLTGDWNLDGGTLSLACDTATFDGAGNLVSDTHDGDGDGTNRWCITDTDDVTAADVLSGKMAWINGAAATGTMANNGAFALTASSTDQEIAAGYWDAGTLAGDADLVAGNVRNGVSIFGVVGNMVAGYLFGDGDASKVLTSAAGNDGDSSYLADNLTASTVKKGVGFGVGPLTGLFFGDTDASRVLTTADGGGAAKGTYDASNLSPTTVRKGTAFGVSSTGAYSGYPGSGWAGSGGSTGAYSCEYWDDDGNPGTPDVATGWYWFEDGNGDGDDADPDDPEDGLCVQAASRAAGLSWNGYDYETNYDATYIAGYTCFGSFPNGTVSSYNGLDSTGALDTTWNDGDCALCQADCYDGVKDLPDQGSYTCEGGCVAGADGYNGPLTPGALGNWKGTRLPSSAEFFGFCSTGGTNSGVGEYETGCSSDVTGGTYGVQVGRTGECIDPIGWEWLSEQHSTTSARVAGSYACSNFSYGYVYFGFRFRAVFRP